MTPPQEARPLLRRTGLDLSARRDHQAAGIVSAYVWRWSIETTPDRVRGRLFEESRAHLGFETQRQGSDLATERTTPCLLGLYSIVVLLAYRLYRAGGLSAHRFAWYDKQEARLSEVTPWRRCAAICRRLSIFRRPRPTPSAWMETLVPSDAP